MKKKLGIKGHAHIVVSLRKRRDKAIGTFLKIIGKFNLI
jgi:hypothetical protein